MTEQEKCIVEMYKLIDDITEKACKHNLSLFRAGSVGGCDQYQGCPPICRVRDEILSKYGDVICEAFRKERDENE